MIFEVTIVFVRVPEMECSELTVSCFSITRWQSKDTQGFDLDSPLMNHLEN